LKKLFIILAVLLILLFLLVKMDPKPEKQPCCSADSMKIAPLCVDSVMQRQYDSLRDTLPKDTLSKIDTVKVGEI
jgi:hypothetical protein